MGFLRELITSHDCNTFSTLTKATFCFARYLSRSDSVIDEFVESRCSQIISEVNKPDYSLKSVHTLSGSLTFLANLYKIGDRRKLRPTNARVFEAIDAVISVFDEFDEKMRDSYIQKLVTKLAGRVALVELKPRLASWKYNRGSRILGQNRVEAEPEVHQEAVDEDINMTQTVEDVIGVLLNSLSDSATVVRWNAAKQLGRVAERLDAENGQYIAEQIIELLDENNSEDTWHGACSALAEFSRRNLIVTDLIPAAIEKVIHGLKYDQRRGDGSVGSNVRDAACYISWTFARGFHPNHIKPFVTKIINALLLTSCFDREVSCRRAAQAALQENIGRLPLDFVPHALDINQEVNFSSIALLENASKVRHVCLCYDNSLLDRIPFR